MWEEVIFALSAWSPIYSHLVYLISITFWAGHFCRFFRFKSLLDLGNKMTPYPKIILGLLNGLLTWIQQCMVF